MVRVKVDFDVPLRRLHWTHVAAIAGPPVLLAVLWVLFPLDDIVANVLAIRPATWAWSLRPSPAGCRPPRS